MQLPPLLFSDLTLLFAVGAITLLIAVELSSSYYGQTNLTLNRVKLKTVAYIVGLLFLIMVSITIFQMLPE
ncbi:MAG: hypothetical protein LBQ98_04250 [Nitrososphaerota archaeon]|nr:hypothetical protein [Nitrososphaerota archaeon]